MDWNFMNSGAFGQTADALSGPEGMTRYNALKPWENSNLMMSGLGQLGQAFTARAPLSWQNQLSGVGTNMARANIGSIATKSAADERKQVMDLVLGTLRGNLNVTPKDKAGFNSIKIGEGGKIDLSMNPRDMPVSSLTSDSETGGMAQPKIDTKSYFGGTSGSREGVPSFDFLGANSPFQQGQAAGSAGTPTLSNLSGLNFEDIVGLQKMKGDQDAQMGAVGTKLYEALSDAPYKQAMAGLAGAHSNLYNQQSALAPEKAHYENLLNMAKIEHEMGGAAKTNAEWLKIMRMLPLEMQNKIADTGATRMLAGLRGAQTAETGQDTLAKKAANDLNMPYWNAADKAEDVYSKRANIGLANAKVRQIDDLMQNGKLGDEISRGKAAVELFETIFNKENGLGPDNPLSGVIADRFNRISNGEEMLLSIPGKNWLGSDTQTLQRVKLPHIPGIGQLNPAFLHSEQRKSGKPLMQVLIDYGVNIPQGATAPPTFNSGFQQFP